MASTRALRFLFIVQGEGRGHMTQAISLQQMLHRQGHQLVHACIGKSKRREIPEFFYRKINAPVSSFRSPNFITDKQQKRIKPWASIFYNIKHLPATLESVHLIRDLVKQHRPDIVVNFYDLTAGLYHRFYPYKHRYICVGHQYLADHSRFRWAPARKIYRRMFRWHNALTAMGCHQKLALSFYPLRHQKNITVVPPLLREEIFRLTPRQEAFFLAYVVNPGYAEELVEWSRQHPEQLLHCFIDPAHVDHFQGLSENLKFHPVEDEHFLQKMAHCSAYVSTAGFESICEALYLQKPVVVVPVQGQYEQACNALDVEMSELGKAKTSFHLDEVKYFIRHFDPEKTRNFKAWVDEAEHRIMEALLYN